MVVLIADEENANSPQAANKNISHHAIIVGTHGVQKFETLVQYYRSDDKNDG